MKSARERAAYLRQHTAAAADQRQAAEVSRMIASAEGRVSKGGMRRRAAAKAHAMQGSSLPDAAAAAAFNSSAAARRSNTASAGRAGKAAISAGRDKPAKEVRQRQHVRAQHFMCSSDACSLAQQQQQQQGSRSAATAARCAAELAERTWGCSRLKAKRRLMKAASSCWGIPATKVSAMRRGQAQTAAVARAAAAARGKAHLQRA